MTPADLRKLIEAATNNDGEEPNWGALGALRYALHLNAPRLAALWEAAVALDAAETALDTAIEADPFDPTDHGNKMEAGQVAFEKFRAAVRAMREMP